MARRSKSKSDKEKSRIELRFDADLHAKVCDLAEGVGLSVNRLLETITRWAVNNAHLGQPEWMNGDDHHPDGIGTIPEPDCVWFGTEAGVITDENGEHDLTEGHVAFFLDFRSERAIRHISPRKSTEKD